MCLFKILLMYGRREHDGALCLSSVTMRELQGGKITKESKVGKQRKEIHSRQQMHQTHSISFPFVPFSQFCVFFFEPPLLSCNEVRGKRGLWNSIILCHVFLQFSVHSLNIVRLSTVSF